MSGLEEPEELAPEQGSLRLASPDDTATVADWERASAAVLRRARRLREDEPDSLVWDRLARTTLDGIEVPPIGQPSDLEGRTTSGRPTRAGAWDVRTQVEVTDAGAANEAALVDLENGATSLLLHLDGHEPPHWETLLDGVLLDLAAVTLDRPTIEQSESFLGFLEQHDGSVHPGTSPGFDPATLEMLPSPVRDDGRGPHDVLLPLVRRAVRLGVRALVVDGTALHDQGASDGQELGWTMAVGISYLRVLAEAGLSVGEAARLLEFRYAVTDEQLPAIAKLRAARRLWARVLEASGGDDVPQAQHAVTSRPMTSRHDPWVNMLRTTVAAFAAGVGGADAVTVVPFDERLGVPDAFGRRIARNTSSLLIEESHLAVVADPAGGSYAVERLTDDLAVAGWAELGRIEAAGGAQSDEAHQGMKQRVRAVAATRDVQVAHRTRPITGLSEFPHLGETLPERPGTVSRYARVYGWAYEDLRARPASAPVLLATMGTVAQHTARATFASNLLAAGGVAVEPAGPTGGVEDVVAAYDGQAVVCLAGNDRAYAEWGADLVAALREAGASYVVLAGRPGESGLTDDTVDDWAAVGVDALAFLTRVREALG